MRIAKGRWCDMGKTIQGYWDCPYCGTVGISGAERICPGCGRPRGTDVTFYMKDKTEYIDRKEGGPDWLCSFCETLNSGQETVCKSCGATREDSGCRGFRTRYGQERDRRAVAILGDL